MLLLLAGIAVAVGVFAGRLPTGALLIGAAVGMAVGFKTFADLHRDLRDKGPLGLRDEPDPFELAVCILLSTGGVAVATAFVAVVVATLVLA